MAWNINGLSRKLSDVDFIQLINSYDIILLSETWISDKHILNLEINDFERFYIYGQKTRGVKKGRQSGGYLYIIRKN